MKLNRNNTILALLLGCAGLLTVNLLSHTGIAAAASPTPAALSIPSPTQLSNSFRNIAKETEPSVVQVISTIQESAPIRAGSSTGNRRTEGGTRLGT